MKRNTISQEILLMTTTAFSQRQLCRLNSDSPVDHLSGAEQMEEACWNGMLNEFFPGIVASGKQIYLWQIKHGKCFLEIKLFEGYSFLIDNHLSIDPYSFLPTIYSN
ncbi:MAG: hypothetical protein ABJA79_02185 [Parafilimonas sp.]